MKGVLASGVIILSCAFPGAMASPLADDAPEGSAPTSNFSYDLDISFTLNRYSARSVLAGEIPGFRSIDSIGLAISRVDLPDDLREECMLLVSDARHRLSRAVEAASQAELAAGLEELIQASRLQSENRRSIMLRVWAAAEAHWSLAQDLAFSPESQLSIVERVENRLGTQSVESLVLALKRASVETSLTDLRRNRQYARAGVMEFLDVRDEIDKALAKGGVFENACLEVRARLRRIGEEYDQRMSEALRESLRPWAMREAKWRILALAYTDQELERQRRLSTNAAESLADVNVEYSRLVTVAAAEFAEPVALARWRLQVARHGAPSWFGERTFLIDEAIDWCTLRGITLDLAEVQARVARSTQALADASEELVAFARTFRRDGTAFMDIRATQTLSQQRRAGALVRRLGSVHAQALRDIEAMIMDPRDRSAFSERFGPECLLRHLPEWVFNISHGAER